MSTIIGTDVSVGNLSKASSTQLNETGTDQHYDSEPNVVGLSDGGYVVVWVGTHYEYDDQGNRSTIQNLFGRIYDADGTSSGEILSIGNIDQNEFGSDYAFDAQPSVVATRDGGFIIAWKSSARILDEDGVTIGSTKDIVTQSFNGDGTERTEIIQVSQTRIYDDRNGKSDFYEDEAPTITLLADGSYVVVWEGEHSDLNEQGHSTLYENNVYARVYSSNGQPLSAEISLDNPNESPWNNDLLRDSEARVTALQDGGFVVAWYSKGNAYDDAGRSRGDVEDIIIQRFNGDGTPASDPHQVSQTVVPEGTFDDRNIDTDPQVVGLANGGYVVSWTGEYRTEQENGSYITIINVFARVYDANDTVVSDEISIGTVSGDWGHEDHRDTKGQITALSSGGFAIAWQSNRNDYDPNTQTGLNSSEVMVQIFDDQGNEQGEAIQISQTVPDSTGSTDLYRDQEPQITSLEHGGFVVTWFGTHEVRDSNDTILSSENNVYVRAYDGDGNAVMEAVSLGSVNESDFGQDQSYDRYPVVSALEDGGFVVSWENQTWGFDQSAGVNTNSTDIMIQKFDIAYEETLETEGLNVYSLKMVEQVSETNLFPHSRSMRDDHDDQDGTIYSLSSGGYVVVWSGQHVERNLNGSEISPQNNVFMKVYNADGQAVGDTVSIGTRGHIPGQAVDTNYDYAPSVAVNPNGGFSVVWSANNNVYSANGTPVASRNDIMMQSFTDMGLATSGVTQLSTSNMGNVSGFRVDTYYDLNPRSVSLEDGTTVVVWQGQHTLTDNSGNPTTQQSNIYAKTIAADGTVSNQMTIGENVANASGNDQVFDVNPNITALSNGGFAISWDVSERMTNNEGDVIGFRKDVNVQIFNANATPLGDARQVSQTNLQTQDGYEKDQHTDWGSDITALSGGGFVVSWVGVHNVVDQSGEMTSTQTNVYVRTYNANGHPVGPELSIGDADSSFWASDRIEESFPTVTALSTGGFAIAWQEYRNEYNDMGILIGRSSDVMFQMFGANGLAISEPIKTTETVLVDQNGIQEDVYQDSQPVITELSDGSLALAWKGVHTNQDSIEGYEQTYENDIFVKVFDDQGNALTPELSLSDSQDVGTGSDVIQDSMPEMIALDNGGFSVVWQSGRDHYDQSATWQGRSSDIYVGEVSVRAFSSAQDDYVTGTFADDVIDGGTGDDVLVGNGGNDTFIFELGDGHDTIRDFEAGSGQGDVIDVSQRGFTSFAQMLENAQNVNDTSVEITLGNDQGILLEGVQIEDLDEDDFLL